jgi:hypothetical protein
MAHPGQRACSRGRATFAVIPCDALDGVQGGAPGEHRESREQTPYSRSKERATTSGSASESTWGKESAGTGQVVSPETPRRGGRPSTPRSHWRAVRVWQASACNCCRETRCWRSTTATTLPRAFTQSKVRRSLPRTAMRGVSAKSSPRSALCAGCRAIGKPREEPLRSPPSSRVRVATCSPRPPRCYTWAWWPSMGLTTARSLCL